ncbi:hypothetical protein [Sporosarcina sp. HYO08]|uniref:hypothetical protein n=1 Tax=Sporosarcina sp. HYO08 TaxID=1759557 RepID=UPI00079175F3|nr:hypothetical protein [Sporosarcina sp. HYO08]KXH83998.1 hypothetical protein AU377_04395 [Sporosarcina sp. HYO08]
MFKDLSPNLKSSITRSITQTFEQYMSEIEWDEDRYSIDDFIVKWREYITTRALWYAKIPDDIKRDVQFHEDLAVRINENIARILNEPPSEEQIAEIQIMQEKLNTHYEYDCKAEAVYVEGLLKKLMESSR